MTDPRKYVKVIQTMPVVISDVLSPYFLCFFHIILHSVRIPSAI